MRISERWRMPIPKGEEQRDILIELGDTGVEPTEGTWVRLTIDAAERLHAELGRLIGSCRQGKNDAERGAA